MQISTAPIVSRLAVHEGRVEKSSPAADDLQKLNDTISAAAKANHVGDPDLQGVQEHIDVLLAVAMRPDDLGRSAQRHLVSIFLGAGDALKQRLGNSAYDLCMFTFKQKIWLADKPISATLAHLALRAEPPVSAEGEKALIGEYVNFLSESEPDAGIDPLVFVASQDPVVEDSGGLAAKEDIQARAPWVTYLPGGAAPAPAGAAPAAPPAPPAPAVRRPADVAKTAGKPDRGSIEQKRADAQSALRLEVQSGKLLSRFNDLSKALNSEGRVADAKDKMRLIQADPKLKGVQKKSQLAAEKARLEQLSRDHEHAVALLSGTDIKFGKSAVDMSVEFQAQANRGSYLVKAPKGHALSGTQDVVMKTGGMAAITQISSRPTMLLDECMRNANEVVTGPDRIAASQLVLSQAKEAHAAATASQPSGESAELLAKLVDEATEKHAKLVEKVALAGRLLKPTLEELSKFQAKQLAMVDEAIASLEKIGSKADLFTRMFKRDIHNDARALELVLKNYRADCILGEGLNSLTAFAEASTPESLIALARDSE